MYLINAQFDVLILLNLIKSSFSSYKNKALYSLLRILYNKEEKQPRLHPVSNYGPSSCKSCMQTTTQERPSIHEKDLLDLRNLLYQS